MSTIVSKHCYVGGAGTSLRGATSFARSASQRKVREGDMSPASLQLALLCSFFSSLISSGELRSCSNSYVVRLANESSSSSSGRAFWKDSCLQSSPALKVSNNSNCPLLHNILLQFNTVIADGDCLELQFMPGEYWFPSLDQIQIFYSLALSAPKGGVSIACSPAFHDTCSTSREDKSSPDDGVNITGKFMMAVNGSLDNDVFVSVDSLDFSNCSKRIQFNLLSNVTVKNCSFM